MRYVILVILISLISLTNCSAAQTSATFSPAALEAMVGIANKEIGPHTFKGIGERYWIPTPWRADDNPKEATKIRLLEKIPAMDGRSEKKRWKDYTPKEIAIQDRRWINKQVALFKAEEAKKKAKRK